MKEIILKNKVKAIIREANVEDAKNITSYLNKIGGESDFLIFGKNEFNMSLEAEEDYIKSQYYMDNSIMVITLINNKIVSIGAISSNSKSRTKHIGTIGISVLKEYWSLGIANEVMNYLIDFASSNNVTKKLALLVREDNYKAIKLYKKFKFEKEGLLKNDICINNNFYNTITMGLLLKKDD